MKTERWTGEMPCNLNGFRNFEFLIEIRTAVDITNSPVGSRLLTGLLAQ